MIDLIRYFLNPFDDERISKAELQRFGVAHLQGMIANNGDGTLSTIITQTTTFLTTMDTELGDETLKLGIQIARTQAKNEYRAHIVEDTGKVQGAVHLAYGKKHAKNAEIFPEGLSVFSDCDDAQVDEKLVALRDALNANLATLGSTPLALVNTLITEWAVIYGQSSSGKAGHSTALNDAKIAATALRAQFKINLHTCALKWPGDVNRAAVIFPQHLLENPQQTPTPTPTPTPPPPTP